jgi:hypothetical protein
MDRDGTLDSTAAVRDVLMSQNPVMARKLLLSTEAAADKIKADQRSRNSAIMTGWKPQQSDYPERTTNPQMRYQEIQAYVSDPTNQQRLAQQPDCSETMQIEMKYLESQVQQYQQNAQIGRSVVKAQS